MVNTPEHGCRDWKMEFYPDEVLIGANSVAAPVLFELPIVL